MNSKKLNVVYIGSLPFPIGSATSKRHRYMVDYMNSQGIQSHYLICDFKQRGKRQNDIKGKYGLCDYRDITPIANSKRYISFWREGKRQLNDWFMPGAQNILIFETVLSPFSYYFFRHGMKIGYKIVFDQVETSYLQGGSMDLPHKLLVVLSEWFSNMAYKHSSAFVISQRLWKENIEKFPHRKLCLLPNSTPQLCKSSRTVLNKPIQLLYTGTYAPKDGVDYLIDGVIEAYESGIDLRLVLLGKGLPKDMVVLDKTIGKDYIQYIGYVSDNELKRYLIESDVLCMTRSNSRFANYGFPFKLSEYLATGNVVLATNVGDVCNYIENKKSAYIVPPENSHEIAMAIRNIAENPQEALKVAAGGLKAMNTHFSIDGVGRIFIDFLKTL